MIDNQSVPLSLRTISRTVSVSVAPTEFFKEVADQSNYAKTIAENVSWIWTTLILPALMFLYGLRKWFRERHA
jgi:hypothetical protein